MKWSYIKTKITNSCTGCCFLKLDQRNVEQCGHPDGVQYYHCQATGGIYEEVLDNDAEPTKNWRVIIFEDDEHGIIVDTWREFNLTMMEVRKKVVDQLGEGDDWKIEEII